jgi:YGGT family
MTYEQRQTTEVRTPAAPAPADTARADPAPASEGVVREHRVATTSPTPSTMAARIVTVVFGLIQLIIGLRILLLVVDAREGNALVAAILDLSRPLVAPFEGILRTNALESGGSVLDLAAVVALVGWTIVELVILGVLRIGRSGDQV